MQVGQIGGIATTGQAQSVPSPRLVHAAHEFEAMIMKELLKPLTAGDGLTGEDGGVEDDSGSGGALEEFASEALGRALSEQGGFGIADSIVQNLSHSGAKNKAAQGTRNLQNKIALKSPR